MQILLGLDVGSTTVKIAAVDARSRQLLHADYRRHHAEQRRCLKELLAEVAHRYPDADLRVAACGSGAKAIADQLGIGFVQEVVANAIAVRALHPEARTAIELGGQDAKVIFFHHDPVTEQLIASDMRMNGVCAGGTGAFIDEIATLLQIPVEEFNGFAERGQRVYQVSGRCGVFAKTDLQPLLNQGVNRADLARSTLHAVVKQTIGGLAQGSTLRAPIVFEGGPLTFNPYLVRAFAEHLDLDEDQIILPERPEVVVAYGCALAVDSILGDGASVTSADRLLAALSAAIPSPSGEGAWPARPLFADDAEREAFLERHALPELPTSLPGERSRLEVVLGIDAGSTTSKLALLDTQGRLVYAFYANNEGQPLEVLRAALLELRDQSRRRGIELIIQGVGTTGYGEQLVAAAFRADHHAVETVAHARAALAYEPRASFVLDIGGQDMKAMFIHDGVITGITLNEACSSGCGAFIETFADSLEVPVASIAERAFQSREPAQLGSRCTVFMRSQVITEQKNRKTPEDTLAGLCRSVVQNVFTKVLRLSDPSSLGNHIVVQGGTFRNDAVLRALESYAQVEVTRAPYPELMGAIGIALLTRERLEQQPAATSFIGLEQIEAFAFEEHPGQSCPFCQNRCNRTIVSFVGGGHYVQGNRCERGEIVGDLSDPTIRQRVRAAKKRIDSVPNLVAERERLLFRNTPVAAVAPPRREAIGIPRALETWIRLPFWRGLFRALGFEVVVSSESSYPLYENGLDTIPSDTVCFPAKLAHGHVLDLADRGVERIFMPVLLSTPAERVALEPDYPCSILAGYGAVIRTNIADARSVPIDTPTFVWDDVAMRNAQLADYLHHTFGVAEADALRAIGEADGCQRAFRTTLRQRGAEVIASVRQQKGFAVVMAARPYHGDELVNHGAASYFTRLGIPVIPVDALPDLEQVDLDDIRTMITSNVQASMYAAAAIVAADPHLELTQIVSFGCGHDAVISDELQRIVQAAGKSMLLLKLDESDVKGPLRLRITSFVNTVRERRRLRTEPPPAIGGGAARFGRDDRRERTIYVPNLSPGFSRMMTALFGGAGYRMETLPLADARALELGKRYVHNDICFPAQVNIGEFLRACEERDLPPESIAFGMHQNCRACRAGQYADLARKALDAAGLRDVPIITTGDDPDGRHSIFRLGPGLKLKFVPSLAILDALEDMLRSTRAYERRPGAAQATFDRALGALCAAMPRGVGALFRVLEQAIGAFNRVDVDDRRERPLVLLLGEIMVAVHPTSNYRIERYLEQQGMEVMTTRLSDFFHQGFLKGIEERANYHASPSLLKTMVDRLGDTLFERARQRTERLMANYRRYRPRVSARELYLSASPHLALVHTAGEGWLILGEILHAAARGVHSFVVVQPFGCMPNHVMGRGMIRAVKERYPLVQVLPLDFDPDTSLGNIENRLQMLIMNARELDARVRPARSDAPADLFAGSTRGGAMPEG
jgi:predicted CoA-substrate-specific enzyme activase